MSENKISKSIQNVSIAFVFQILYIVASFVVRTVFIRQLGNDYLSLNGLFSNIISLLSFAELGIGTAITYSLYRPLVEENENRISSIMHFYKTIYRLVRITILTIGLGIMAFLQYFINDIDPSINYYTIYLLFLANTYASYIFSYKKTLLIADQKNYIVVCVEKTLFIVQSIIQCILLLIFHNFIAYLVIQILFTLLMNVAISIYVSQKYPYINKRSPKLDKLSLKTMFSDIRSIFAYKVGAVVLNGTDNLLISNIIATSTVGLYSNYAMVISAVNTVLMQCCNSLAATIGQYSVEQDNEKGIPVFQELYFISYWIFSVCAICLFVLLNPLISVWLGSEYKLPLEVVLIIVIVFYISGINQMPSLYRTAFGIFKQAKYLPIVAAIINVVLSILFGRVIGLFGIFLATAVAKLCTFNIFDPLLIFRYGFKKSAKRFFLQKLIYSIGLITNCMICFKVYQCIKGDGFTLFCLNAIVVFVLSNLLFVLFYIHTKECQALKRRVIVLINRRKKRKI